LLVFSAHGRFVYHRLRGIDRSYRYGLPHWRDTLVCRSYEQKGIGYANYFGAQDYGISLSDPSWVCEQIRQIPSLAIVHYSAKAWHGVHDVYACKKLSEIEPERISAALYWKHRLRDHTPGKIVQVMQTLGLRRGGSSA
jgi:hypothetical protein